MRANSESAATKSPSSKFRRASSRFSAPSAFPFRSAVSRNWAIREATGAPINVYAHGGTAPLADLQAAGIQRLSLGPNLLKAAFSAVHTVAQRLQEDGSYGPFTRGVMSTDEIRRYVDRGAED